MTRMPLLALAALSGFFVAASFQAKAQSTVECHSVNYRYTECQAPLRSPQLIHQISSSSCILNNSWGFNPRTRRIWVADGCSGVFADASGYHHGRGDSYDRNGRRYDDRGHDMGALAAGVVAAAIIGAASNDEYRSRSHTTTNNYYYRDTKTNSSSDYSGCHGIGCLVDKPTEARDTSQDVDPTVEKFDKVGNPNYDTDGNDQGAHGLGKLVDNPDAPAADDSSNDDESKDSENPDNN